MRAAIVREPQAIAVRNVVSEVRLAGADPDGLGVAWIDGRRTNRANCILRPNVAPLKAAVRRLPDAAIGGAEVVQVWIGIGARNAGSTAARDCRSDVSPREILQRRQRDAGSKKEPQRRPTLRLPAGSAGRRRSVALPHLSRDPENRHVSVSRVVRAR